MDAASLYIKKALKTFKYLALTLLAILLLLGLYLLTAYLLSRIGTGKDATPTNDISIYILTNGVHTDLVMPIKNDQIDWSQGIKFEHTVGKDSAMTYVALGWGDKGFYLNTPTWADLKFSTGFKAAFALSTSAIHATFYKTMPESEQCVRIPISREEYAQLIKFVRDSFTPDDEGHFIHIPTTANYGKDDSFYEAGGSYSLFYTCNTWANDGLKSCGQQACLWTAFDTGIFYQYQK